MTDIKEYLFHDCPELNDAVVDRVVVRVKYLLAESISAERNRILGIVRHFSDLNEADDEYRYQGLAEWMGNDDCGRWIIDEEKLIELIESGAK